VEIGRWLEDGAARARDAALARGIGFPGAAERCARELLAAGGSR
jgi:hypothetical protein